MKRIVLGSGMLLSGPIATAVLLSGTMSCEMTGKTEGVFSYAWCLTKYGLMPALYIFIAVAVIGGAIAIWGLFDKSTK